MDALHSVAQFLEKPATRYFAEARGRWIFRGHSDARFKLVPSVDRGAHTSNTREKHERSLFDIFLPRGTRLSSVSSNERLGVALTSSAPRSSDPTVGLDAQPASRAVFCCDGTPGGGRRGHCAAFSHNSVLNSATSTPRLVPLHFGRSDIFIALNTHTIFTPVGGAE
jgi:hypothetical protein